MNQKNTITNKIKSKRKISENKKNKILRNDIDFYESVECIKENDEFIEDDDILLLEVDIKDENIIEEDEEDVEEILSEEPEENIKIKKQKKETFYVCPKEFDNQIMTYYDTNIINDKLAEMISKISHKLSYANNFINYSYREEMVGDGIIRMLKALFAK